MDYDFEAKQNGYRVPAWQFVDRMCRTPRGLRKVAILDTAQGLEVRHLVRIGYKPENILAVNYSAAQLAAMTTALRRDGIEGVRTKAGEFTEVLLKWAGQLHVIGFDTTSNLASASFVSLAEVTNTHRPECFLAVALAGREGPLVFAQAEFYSDLFPPKRDSLNQSVNPRHYGRVLCSVDAATSPPGLRCAMHVNNLRWASYGSASGQAMVWWCAQLGPHEHLSPGFLRRKEVVIPPACCTGGRGSVLSACQELVRNRAEVKRLEKERVATERELAEALSAVYREAREAGAPSR